MFGVGVVLLLCRPMVHFQLVPNSHPSCFSLSLVFAIDPCVADGFSQLSREKLVDIEMSLLMLEQKKEPFRGLTQDVSV